MYCSLYICIGPCMYVMELDACNGAVYVCNRAVCM